MLYRVVRNYYKEMKIEASSKEDARNYINENNLMDNVKVLGFTDTVFEEGKEEIKSSDFSDRELDILSDCVLFTLNKLYESVGTFQDAGINVDIIKKNIKEYQELNSKICGFKREEN